MIAEPAPRLRVESLDAEPGVGRLLAEERRGRGLTLEQVAAATRIRRRFLEAIERDELSVLPGAVYVRGYVRAYAAHLGLEPDAVLARLEPPAAPAALTRSALSLARLAPRLPAGLVLTGPMLAGALLAAGIALFSAYAWYEMRSARLDAAPPAAAVVTSPPPIASPMPLPSVAAAAATAPQPGGPAGHLVAVAIKATELVWVQVTVDGKPAYGDSGRLLQPGAEDVFVGQKVRIQSGKPTLQVSVSGGDYAPLGSLGKEYSAQT